MNPVWKQLQGAFVDDHRTLTRGYTTLIRLLDERDYAGAATAARQLDRRAGPHIAFEESFLYPIVGESRGEDYVALMRQEHATILDALTEIRGWVPSAESDEKGDQQPDEAAIEDLKHRLEHGLDHAAACGSLLSHLKTLPDADQQRALERLLQFRETGSAWSELSETS